VSSAGISVLKFGSSILRGTRDLARATHEVYRELREGRRVVAVVSAYGGTTDRLLARARAIDERPDARVLAQLVSTGEARATAELALALRRAGLDATSCESSQLGLCTRGEILDAQPIELDPAGLRRALERHAVVVIPGFLGRGAQGETTLLGRGGSDLTALIVAQRLGARCLRLLKDVDGIWSADPAADANARKYAALSWDAALAVGGGVVQEKALRFAREQRIELEVAALGSVSPTLVGRGPSRWAVSAAPQRRLRVALLGLGTVGLGVQRELERASERFDVLLALVRDRGKLRTGGTGKLRLVQEPKAVLACECDVLIELLGGVEPAATLVRDALERGSDVVTANKALVVEHGRELSRLARARGVQLRYSASVGGALPVLENIERIARERVLLGLEGVVNSTTNFVLDRLAQGQDLAAAVRAAQQHGLAEADPRADLSGEDAAHKLELMARAAYGPGVQLAWKEREGIEAIDPERVRAAADAGGAVRLVASLALTPDGVEARLAPRTLERGHVLAEVQAEENCVVLAPRGTAPLVLRGRGAGRWPTTESVLGDVLAIERARSSEARVWQHARAQGGAS
jgi:homoserine dehydrogenase